ncbi:uncharacterized protein LOC143914365 [Arctopsyche grandis]|uniref:uncharacterized protein LOC143914365 n=1 Tax=Arctopsyche grandis TaxID=121162 RepID=UPI00406D71F3
MADQVITTQPKNPREDAGIVEEAIPLKVEEAVPDPVSLEDVNPKVDVERAECCECWRRFKRGCRGIHCSSDSCNCCANTDPEAWEDLFWCCLSIFRWSAFTDCWNCCVECGEYCSECGVFCANCCLNSCTECANCCWSCAGGCAKCLCQSDCCNGLDCGDCCEGLDCFD